MQWQGWIWSLCQQRGHYSFLSCSPNPLRLDVMDNIVLKLSSFDAVLSQFSFPSSHLIDFWVLWCMWGVISTLPRFQLVPKIELGPYYKTCALWTIFESFEISLWPCLFFVCLFVLVLVSNARLYTSEFCHSPVAIAFSSLPSSVSICLHFRYWLQSSIPWVLFFSLG